MITINNNDKNCLSFILRSHYIICLLLYNLVGIVIADLFFYLFLEDFNIIYI